MSASVAAIVLAAGQSRRMEGRNKLLADVSGRPMIRTVVETVIASPASPVIVVTGFEAERVSDALSGLGVSLVFNADFETGMASSLKAGLAALPDGAQGVLVVLGDMPDVTADDVAHLISAFEKEGCDRICLPIHDARRGNPALLPRWLFQDLETLSGDTGARALIAAHEDRVLEVAATGPGVLHDVDTPGDMEA